MNTYEILMAIFAALGILVSIALSLAGFTSKKEREKIEDNAKDVQELKGMIEQDRTTLNQHGRDLSTLHERSKNDKEIINNLKAKYAL